MSYVWSFSRFSKVEQCGLSFYRTYVMGERGEPSDAMSIGSLVHKTLEMLGKQAKEHKYTGPYNEQKAIELYRSLWPDFLVSGGNSKDFTEGAAMVSDFVRRHKVIDHTKIIGVESRLELPLSNGDKVIGFIDAIERDESGQIVIVDYKTNRQMYSRGEVENSLQLGIYLLWARHAFPGERCIAAYDMVRHDFRQYTTRTDAQLDSLELYLMTLIERVDRWKSDEQFGAYPATLNRWCFTCSFKSLCPAYQSALELGELETIDPGDLVKLTIERKKMASVEKIAKSRKKEIDQIIKDKCSEHGSVEIGGKDYYLYNSIRRTYDAATVAEQLAETLGGTAADWIGNNATISKAKIDEILKSAELEPNDRKLLEVQINALAHEKHEPQVRSKKRSS